MEKLTKDELFSLAINLDLPDILKLCSSNKKIDQRLCLRDNIWINKLKEFPDYQKHLEDFKNMSKKEIYTLLYQIKSLKEKIDSPYSIYEIYKFRDLNLALRKLKEIPKEVGSLINLEVLWVGGNYITEVPKELGKLTNLRELYLGGNYIKELPKEMGNLTHLKELYLGNNKLESIPKEFGNLTNLRELVLFQNPIRLVPEEIKSIPYLDIKI